MALHSPLYFYSETARQAMYEVVKTLPEHITVYIVGGVVRNALIAHYHNETWLQRDYDQIVTSGSVDYFDHLESLGFAIGLLDKPTQRVMAKPLVAKPRDLSYEDSIVFDIHMVDGTTIEENLLHSTGLLINGFALPIHAIFDKDWQQKLIQIPGALDAIQNKQIRVNIDGYQSEANNFFACMRFIGAGFKAPPVSEVQLLLKQLVDLDHERYQRNLVKLSNYVGGEDKARAIIRDILSDEVDIYDEQATKRYIATTNI